MVQEMEEVSGLGYLVLDFLDGPEEKNLLVLNFKEVL